MIAMEQLSKVKPMKVVVLKPEPVRILPAPPPITIDTSSVFVTSSIGLPLFFNILLNV